MAIQRSAEAKSTLHFVTEWGCRNHSAVGTGPARHLPGSATMGGDQQRLASGRLGYEFSGDDDAIFGTRSRRPTVLGDN